MSTPSLAFMSLSCVRLRCVYTKPPSRFSLCHTYVLGAYTPSPSHVSVCLTCIPSRAFFWSTPCMRPASLRETKKSVVLLTKHKLAKCKLKLAKHILEQSALEINIELHSRDVAREILVFRMDLGFPSCATSREFL